MFNRCYNPMTLVCSRVHKNFTFHCVLQQVLQSVTFVCFSLHESFAVSMSPSTDFILWYFVCNHFSYLLRRGHCHVITAEHVWPHEHITTHWPLYHTANHTLGRATSDFTSRTLVQPSWSAVTGRTSRAPPPPYRFLNDTSVTTLHPQPRQQ